VIGRIVDRRGPGGLLRVVVVLIGVHSCALGLALLFAPLAMTGWLGFEAEAAFFPAQSGAFLLILGVCYLLALRDRALIAVIVVSKVIAVFFLVAHAAFLDAPPMVWAAATGDAAMLVVLLVTLRRARRTAAL